MTEQWQELKETIIKMRDNDGIGTQQEVCKFLANYMDTLEKQITDEWIPCSERLPNEFVDVLCNTDSEEIFIATYLGKMNDGTNCFDDNDGMMWEGDVIAWMPLPQPYKAESEETE